MQDGIQKLNRVVSEISGVVMIERGDTPIVAECTLISLAVKDLQAEFAPRCEEKQQIINADIPENLCALLDYKLLTGVLRELLENALTYSAKGTSVHVRAKKLGNVALVEVEDVGVGISNDDQRHLFEKFVRGKDAAKYDPNGTGVGLAIARGIIERAGGRLWLRSREWHGTTASLVLPLGDESVMRSQPGVAHDPRGK
jgi:signal transduction histidine kinase